ncbi:MAG: response regulator transcription factor [Bacteroidales bacterium]|nr:response regulator transcription factor [Bacteroidales bacterium]
MKAVIIEDEQQTQQFLKTLIEKNFKEIEITACLDSIESAAEYFSAKTADLIFMDIQLKDGYCFFVFEKVRIESYIIFITAYDEYALKAFESNTIDYILKPITESKIVSAIKKYYKMVPLQESDNQAERLVEMLKQYTPNKYKKRFIVKVNTKIIVINECDIAYFISKERVCYLYTKDDRQYIVNYTLDSVFKELNPKRFYRISRTCIAAVDSIKAIDKYLNGRLRLKLEPEYKDDVITVSRDAVSGFLAWVENAS